MRLRPIALALLIASSPAFAADPARSRQAVDDLAASKPGGDGRRAHGRRCEAGAHDPRRPPRRRDQDHARRRGRGPQAQARRSGDAVLYKVFGEKPKDGRSLFISMHGGGGAPARVNDQQYENQKKLYKPEEGVYLAPRAPSNTWDLWHQKHVDAFFERLIEDMVVFEDVNPNRVYLMGYSAGGDGVYQLAPRMADRLAAASMMAGHPNESQPLGLRNIGFALHVGGNDAAYDRNKIAKAYGEKLDKLREADPDGYVHLVEIHAGRPHWMNLEDASAVPWMARFRRDPAPKKVVWLQDDVTHDQFYWLGVEPGKAKKDAMVVASVVGQEVRIEKAEGVETLLVRLDDRLVDLDKPVKVVAMGKTVFEGIVPRTVATIRKTLGASGDPKLAFEAEIPVVIPTRGG